MLSNLKCTRQCLHVKGNVHILHRGIAKQTHYEVLQVPRSATATEIKRAYLDKCKQVHPDRNHLHPENHNKFLRLSEAYRILKDPLSKREYDRKLNMGINVTESYGPPPQQNTGPRPDERIYKVYQYSYYGASQEERAQKERDYYRRMRERAEKEQMGWTHKKEKEEQLNLIFGVTFCVVCTILYAFFQRQAEREREFWRRYYNHENDNKDKKKDKIGLSLPCLLGISAIFTGTILMRGRFEGAYKQQYNRSTKDRPSPFIYLRLIYFMLAASIALVNIVRHHWNQRNLHLMESKRNDPVVTDAGYSYPKARRRYLRTKIEMEKEQMSR